MILKAKSKEIIQCTHCGEEITNDNCAECNTWFEDDETIYCDEIRNHYCKKCGKPKYKKEKMISDNSTLDQFP